MGLLDYFRILKVLIILFLLFVCMNYIPNQHGKVMEETLAGFNSDDVKTTLGRQTLLQNNPPSFASSLKTLPHSSVT